jgi:hypothetical protein
MNRTTRALLIAGAAAGPLWVGVVLVQMLVRPGFDVRRHAVSVLTLGDLGWVQVANFIVAGLLVIAGAAGLRRALGTGRARVWGPLLVGVYGAGLVGAGLFVPDPMNGFPPGTSGGQFTTHGLLHFVVAGVAFIALIVASGVVFARRFAALGAREWTVYSVVTGGYWLITWAALIPTSGSVGVISVAFAIAVLNAWTWLTLLFVSLIRSQEK